MTGGTWNGAGTVTGLVTSSSGAFNLNGVLTASSGLAVTGGTLAGNGFLVGSLNYTSGSSSTFGGAIFGSGATVTMNNASSTLILTGSNTYTGATNVTTGTLEVDGSLAAGSTVNVATSGALTGSGTINGNATLTGNGVISLGSTGRIAGTLNATGGGAWNGLGTVSGLVTNSSGNFSIGGTLTAPSGVAITGGTLGADWNARRQRQLHEQCTTPTIFEGVIAGAGATFTLNKASTQVVLGGINTYTGATIVTAGTLQIGDGFTGNLTGTSGVTVAAGAFVLMYMGAGTTFTPSINLNGTTASLYSFDTGTNTFSGAIFGAGTFTQPSGGTGTTILTNNSDSYSGATSVSAGILEIGNGTSGNLTGTSGITLSSGGDLYTNLALRSDLFSKREHRIRLGPHSCPVGHEHPLRRNQRRWHPRTARLGDDYLEQYRALYRRYLCFCRYLGSRWLAGGRQYGKCQRRIAHRLRERPRQRDSV